MPSFKDANGREWTIRFDGLLLADLRTKHNINLADIAGSDYLLIDRDPSLLTVGVCHLCRDQLKAANTSREQLAAALVGQSLDDALAAVWEAAKVFFPPRRLSELQSNCAQLTQLWKEMGPAMAVLNQPGVPPAIGEAMTAAMTQGMALGMRSTGSSGSATRPSAAGPAANPSSAASDSPATAESVPTG